MCEMVEKDFFETLERLLSLGCWAVVAGEGTGSIVSLDFGDKIKITSPLNNPHLSELAQKYRGVYGLYIECSWRLNDAVGAVCSSCSSNENDGPMVKGLARLISARVVSVQADNPSRDLMVCFDSGHSLHVFCDYVDEEMDNYSLFSPDKTFVVSGNGKIGCEKRNRRTVSAEPGQSLNSDIS